VRPGLAVGYGKARSWDCRWTTRTRQTCALYIQRQIRVMGRTLVFALPKRGRKRRVPLSTGVLAALRMHEREFPSTEITLPWDEPGGQDQAVTGSRSDVFASAPLTALPLVRVI
jgi:hypothetical protein